MERLAQDVRHAVLSFLKAPAFSLLALVTIALGIGANTAVFSILHATLLKPLAFSNAGQLVRISADFTTSGLHDVSVSVPEFDRFAERRDLFSHAVGIFSMNANLTGAGIEPERIEGLLATPGYFTMLGVRPEAGRLFDERDAHPGIAGVAVLSHRLWARLFGGRTDAIGRTIRLDGDVLTIIGVLPATFRHPGPGIAGDPDVFAPAGFRDAPFGPPQPGVRTLNAVIARLQPDVTLERASHELSGIADAMRREYPDVLGPDRGWQPTIAPLQESLVGTLRGPLLLLSGAVGVVLLIACANVAGLLVARNASRLHEFAVRRAMGASPRRLARQLLTESLTLSIAGGLLGLLVGAWLLVAMRALSPDSVRTTLSPGFAPSVLLFSVALTLLTGLAFGLWPLLDARRVSAADALRASSRTLTAGRRHTRLRRVLVVGQFAMTVLLLVGATLLLRSFARLMSVDPGLSADRVLAARLWLPKPNNPESGPYATQDARMRLFDRALQNVLALPGVERAGWINWLPMGGERRSTRYFLEGRRGPSAAIDMAEPFLVSEGYFETVGIAPMRGRLLTSQDTSNTPLVMVISESFARRYFPGEDPIGRRIRVDLGPGIETPWQEIVGIVRDVHTQGLDAAPAPQVYRSIRQRSDLAMVLMVRTTGSPAGLDRAVRDAVRRVDPDLPLFSVQPMTEVMAGTTRTRRFVATLVAAFAVLALTLSCIGIYSVVAFLVEQRTSEIGLRVALGATAARIARLIVGNGLTLALAGIAFGLFAAGAFSRLLATQLFEVSPLDPLTFAVVPVLMLALAALACALPARRAARMDPIAALRRE